MAPQPLHIFQKDVRHLWPETLITLVLFAAFAWAVPYGWQASDISPYVGILSGLLHVLMPIAWMVVIARLIQDEPLVGDRQFWTSRPYHWASLLAAKVLYLLVFIYLPFLLMQVYLLKHAGLYPTTVIPALLHNLLLLTVLVIVPIAAIATVTSTFPRLLLSVIGAVIYILVVGVVYGLLVFQRMPAPHLSGIIETLVIVLPAAALLYQYATRRTQTSRILLLATPLLVVLVLALTPAQALIKHAYPVAAAADAPKLTAIPVPASAQTPAGSPRLVRGNVLVSIPFKVEGVDKDSNYVVEGVAANLTSSAGNWSSPFLSSLGTSINDSLPYTVVRLFVPSSVFNKVGKTPADVHFSLAADRLHAGKPTTWRSSLLPFSIPGHAVCFQSTEDPDAPATCRFPFKSPEILYASAPVSAGACNSGAQPVSGHASLNTHVNTLNFDPVILMPLNFTPGPDGNQRQGYKLCPGTPISFLEADSAGKARLEVDYKQLVLDPLALRITPPSATPQQPGPQPE